MNESGTVKTYEALIEKMRKTDQTYDERKIDAAYALAEEAHKDQKRENGEPYITHPIAVASVLLDLCMDTDTICAALLHDVVEDTDITLAEIRERFGEGVAALVDGVTKISKVHLNVPDSNGMIFSTKEELKNENTRKILIAMSKDIRVIILKLADRLHNMRTLANFGEDKAEKRKLIALETMSFYAPLAHRLGMSHIKDEMENLSLFYLDQFAYEEIENELDKHKRQKETFIDSIKARIAERLSDVYISPPPIMEGRVKGVYSLYKKMFTKRRTLDEIYDLYAVRIIVNTTAECYTVLGIMHDTFSPLPNRFKDYIANPKVNGYQSLHTIVLSRQRQPFEIQIRTREMHNTACFGIASHWRYKLGDAVRTPQNRFEFIQNMLDEQDDEDSLVEIVKKELDSDEVYVFTPKGDVIHLPQKATVLDFAYSIHTQIGHKTKGAKIHGKSVTFQHVLEIGDIVDIELSDLPEYGPTRSWLDYVVTPTAKNKIRSWLKAERKDENIPSGRAFVESVLLRQGKKGVSDETRAALARNHGFETLDEFYEAIGYGRVETQQVSDWINDEIKIKTKNSSGPEIRPATLSGSAGASLSNGVIVEGVAGCHTKLANCCNPLPGDEIVGFITRNNSVSVHKKECINVTAHRLSERDAAERLTKVRWSDDGSVLYTASVDINADDDDNLITNVTDAVKELNLRTVSLNARSKFMKIKGPAITFTTQVANTNQLAALIARLSEIDGVTSVKRAGTTDVSERNG